jgi:glycosyltransferase involved in cell wall biosynthesis
MRILFVTPAPPVPPLDGARLIVSNLARALAPEHTLHLVCFGESDGTAADMRDLFDSRRIVPLPHTGKTRKWISSLGDSLPMWVRRFESPEMRRVLQEVAARNQFDVAHVDTAEMAQYADAIAPVPRVLAPHDSLSLVLEQRQNAGLSAVDRMQARIQANKMRQYEASQYAAGELVCVVTEQEKQHLHELAPTLAVRVIPNGVNTDYFSPLQGIDKPGHIGFLGVMDYMPNRRAARFFAQEVMPRIWDKAPGAVFTIIGRSPARDILTLAKDCGFGSQARSRMCAPRWQHSK